MENKNPNVSILTLTTNSRDKFIGSMVRNVLRQEYDHSLLEWLVVGDGNEESMKIFDQAFHSLPKISCRYIIYNKKRDIGSKRNFACEHSTYKILANMDSDDYYTKSYISHSVDSLKKGKFGIVGCRDMLIFYPKVDGKMVMIRGSSIHEATMVFTKNHWKQFKFTPGMYAEGASMVDGKYLNEIDIRRAMLCIAHSNNSYDKSQFLNKDEIFIPESRRESMIEEFSFV